MGIHYSLPFSFYSLQLYSLKQQTVLKKLGQKSLLQTILIYFLVSKNYSRYIYQQFSQRTYHRKKSTTCSLTILLRHYDMVIKYFIVSNESRVFLFEFAICKFLFEYANVHFSSLTDF